MFIALNFFISSSMRIIRDCWDTIALLINFMVSSIAIMFLQFDCNTSIMLTPVCFFILFTIATSLTSCSRRSISFLISCFSFSSKLITCVYNYECICSNTGSGACVSIMLSSGKFENSSPNEIHASAVRVGPPSQSGSTNVANFLFIALS